MGRGALRRLGVLGIWLAATAVLVVVGWPVENYRDFDFIGMWLAARGLLRGEDIYDPTVFRELFLGEGSEGYAYIPGTGFGYALPAAVLSLPFGALPFGIAAPLWFTTSVLLITTGLWSLSRALFGTSFRRDAVLLLGLSLGLQPLWVSLFTGQVGGMLLGITAHATALLARSRPRAAGATLALDILKPHLFLWSVPLLLLISRLRVRIAVGMLAAGGALLAISVAIRGDWPFAWLRSAGPMQGMNVSRANAWGLAPDNARYLGWIVVVLVLAAFIVWWRSGASTPALWAGAIPLSLVSAPYSWSYDYGLLAIPAAAVIAGAGRLSQRARAAVLVSLAAIWVALPWWLYLEAHRTGAEPTAAVVPVALLALLIGTDRLARRSTW